MQPDGVWQHSSPQTGEEAKRWDDEHSFRFASEGADDSLLDFRLSEEEGERRPPIGARESATTGSERRPPVSARESTTELVENVRGLILGQQRLERLLLKLAQSLDCRPTEEASEAIPEATNCRAVVVGDGEDSDKIRGRDTRDSLGAQWTSTRGRSWLQHVQMRAELKGDSEQLDQELSRACQEPDRTVSLTSAKGLLVDSGAKSGGVRAVLSPTSRLRALIDLCSLVVLVYEMTSVPYLIVFESDADVFMWLAYMTAAFWALDICINFRTGVFKHGELVMDPSAIRRHYLRSGFTLDFAVLVVDLAAIVQKQIDTVDRVAPSKLLRIFKIWRVVRLAKVVRLRRIKRAMDVLNARRRSTMSSSTRLVLETCNGLFILVWLNHLIACFWCYLAREWGESSDTGVTWLDLTTGGQEYGSLGDGYQYTTALHFAISQMTPGSMQVFPQNTAERVYNILCLVAGLLVFSTLISSISATVASFRNQMQRHNAEMDAVSIFLGRHRVSPALRLSICTQVEAKLAQGQPPGVNELTGLNMISLSLRSALQLELCNPHLLQHPYFSFLSEADATSWEEICRVCVDFSTLVADETLFLVGVQATSTYFVMAGRIHYTLAPMSVDDHDHEPFPRDVKPEELLCEAALWCQWRHMGSAEVPVGHHCELLCLSSERTLKVLSSSPLNAALTWAYAKSFHTLMINARPLTCSGPNDLDLTFEPAETISAMPRQAAIFIGQTAINVLQRPHDRHLGSYLPTARRDGLGALMDDVYSGRSTLLVSKTHEVVRCLRLASVKLTRPDGRVLVHACLSRGTSGLPRAACELPGGRQEVGEHLHDCLQRLLEDSLQPLSEGLVVNALERQVELGPSSGFDVPTKCIRTVVSTEWQWQQVDERLGEHLLAGRPSTRRPTLPGNGKPDSLLSLSTSSQANSRMSSLSSQHADAEEYANSEVYFFPSGELYTWVTEEELEYFGGRRGQRALLKWLQRLDALAELKHRAVD